MKIFACTGDDMADLDITGLGDECELCGKTGTHQMWGVIVCDECYQKYKYKEPEPEPIVFDERLAAVVEGREY